MLEPEQTVVVARPVSAVGTIQAGDRVLAADGEEIGAVVRVDDVTFEVKSKGIMGRTVTIPRSLVRESEDGRVELSVSKRDL